MRKNEILRALSISFILMLLYLGLLRPLGALETLSLKAQDLLFKVRRHISQPPDVLKEMLLIVVDDESIEQMNQRWPFPRKVFADLIDQLSVKKPKLLAFDFVFSGKSDPVDDFLLANSIERAPPVVLASYVDVITKNYILPDSELLSRAAGAGIINKMQDHDLTVRRANLIYPDVEGSIVGWPWEIEIAKVLFGLDSKQFKVWQSRKTFINYRFDLSHVKRLQFWQLVQNQTLGDLAAGKIVLIGTTSKALHDFHRTPLGLMPGVVINMNLLANILSHDFLKLLPVPWVALFLLVFSFCGIYLSWRFEILSATVCFSAVTALFLLLTFGLFLKEYVFDYLTPLVFGWLGFFVVSFYRYFFTLLENIQLRTKTVTDPLTGLYNRRVLEASIEKGLEKNSENGVSILMIDIDNFKSINDQYGHQFGDDVLKNISFAVKEELRKQDVGCRYGGEEFCVVLPDTRKDHAVQIAERIRSKVENHKFSYVNQMAHFTVSIGVASSQADQLMASRSLIRAADQALYEAKHKGKNRVESCKLLRQKDLK